MDDKKPDWYNGSQKAWDDYISSLRKTFIQRPFRHHSYLQDTESLQRIMHFVKCIKQEELPDNETLLWMANSFERYIEKESTRSKKDTSAFEKAFAMPPKQKAGSAVKRLNKELKDHKLFNAMAEMLVEDEGIKQEEAAHKAIIKIYGEDYDESKTIDAASLARDFRGWPAHESTIELFKIRKKRKTDK